MKCYSVTHRDTGEMIVGPFWDAKIADMVRKSFGDDFVTTTWIGFNGFPAMACVFRDDRQLEAICTYRAQADIIAKSMNENAPGRYEVRAVLVNTTYPHAHGEYSV